jgi:spore germination cell wall hydrolase CwlJ-like protein
MRSLKVFVAAIIGIFSIITTTLYATDINLNNDKILDIKYSELTRDTKREIDCLADNIYKEAGHEPESGKVAVALVTLNRVEDPRFPKDICGVVKQKVNTTCQFSWICISPSVNRSSDAYKAAKRVALHVYANYEKLTDITLGSLYYHADYVNPGWKLQKTVVIGRHIFYKEGGKRHDAKTKSPTEGRFSFQTLVFPIDGRD